MTLGVSTSLSSIVLTKEAKGCVSTFYCTEEVYSSRAEAGRVVLLLGPPKRTGRRSINNARTTKSSAEALRLAIPVRFGVEGVLAAIEVQLSRLL